MDTYRTLVKTMHNTLIFQVQRKHLIKLTKFQAIMQVLEKAEEPEIKLPISAESS